MLTATGSPARTKTPQPPAASTTDRHDPRARQTLSRWRFASGNPLIHTLPDNPALLRRPVCEWRPALVGPGIVMRSSLKEIDLGHAGRVKPNTPTHRRITARQVGDPLRLIEEARGYAC